MNRRTVGAALGIALAATGALVGVAGPAYAVGVPNLVTATSNYDSLQAKSATATCPAGQQVYGGGGTIYNGQGFVTLTDVIPNAALTQVTVWGHENGNYPGDWDVTAYATCAPASATLVLVSTTSAFNAASPKTVGAACPNGTSLYGTGYRLDGPNGNVFISRLTPNPALTGVLVRGDEDGMFGGMWQVTAYAICDVPTGPMVRHALASANNGTAAKSVDTVACPAGSYAYGLGGEIDAAAVGDVLMTNLQYEPALDYSTAGAEEHGVFGANWDVTAFTICAQP
jgi:hypothetical protein